MLCFTVTGVILAVAGTILMTPEIFWGYAGIFADVAEQVKEEVWIKHLRFFSDEKKAREKEPVYRRRAYRWRKMRTAGFIMLMAGVHLQILGIVLT